MEKIILKTNKREAKAARNLRREGKLPAVVYGRGNGSLSIELDRNEFEKAYREAGTSQLIVLNIGEDGKKNVLVHEIQFHAVTGTPMHVDFYEISMKEKITTEVPLVFTGDSIAVIEMSGSLMTNRDSIEVECLPGDLPHEIEVDISPLVDFEAAIHIKDLKIPAGVEIKNDPEEMVVTVEAPRSEEEMAELDEEIATPDLPEAEQGGDEESTDESKEE